MTSKRLKAGWNEQFLASLIASNNSPDSPGKILPIRKAPYGKHDVDDAGVSTGLPCQALTLGHDDPRRMALLN